MSSSTDSPATASKLPGLDPYLPVAVGLALGGRRADGVHIDLLPPEARRAASGRRTRRRLAAAAIVVVLAGVSLLQAVGGARQRDRLADQQRTNRVLQAEIDKLSGPLQAELATARQGVTAALAGDVSWPRVLEDLAGTLPESVWLTTFSLQPTGAATAGATTPDAAGAAATGTGGTIGTAAFAATGLDFPSVAAWLDRVPRIPYYLNLFVFSATKAEVGPRPLVNFTSSASVGPAARSDRLQRILGPQP